MSALLYSGYRFPPDIIQRAVWMYLRFTLSFRDVEELLAERGIVVTYESIRRCAHLRPGHRATAADAAPQAAWSVASRRNVRPCWWPANVSLAGRRRRRRGPGFAPPDHAGHEGRA